MKLLKQALAVLGTVVVIAAIVALVTPKTARALVSSPVLVTNAPSQAVPNTDVARSASQNVELFCFSNAIGISGLACGQVSPQGGDPQSFAQYTVPAGQNLVITTLDITTYSSSAGLSSVVLAEYNPQTFTYLTRESFTVQNGATAQFQFPVAGLVISPGIQPTIANNNGGVVRIRGFLTAN